MPKPITFTLTPLNAWSAPGCGKTALFSALARQQFGIEYDAAMKKHKPPAYARELFDAHRPTVESILAAGCFTLFSAMDDPVDSGGCIAVKNGASVRMLPLFWHIAAHIPILIFCDEMTAGSHEQRSMILRVADDSRSLHGVPLHPDSRVCAACNPPEFAAGAAQELPAPVLSRFRHITIGPEYAVEWMQHQTHQFVRLCGVYFRNNPAAALARPEEIRAAVENQLPFATPRAWTRAAMEIMESDMDALPQYVGAQPASQFLNWFTKMDLPSPVEILAGRCTTIPARGDAVMATAASVAALLGSKPSAEALGHAMTWYRLAAEAGQVANCAVEMDNIIKQVGIVPISRYAKDLAPYGAVLKKAGII